MQVIKLEAVGHINLKNNPYIIRLKKENEEISDLLKLRPEELLMRWFNYHLKNAGHDRQVTNFSKDIQDGENYTVLLNQLDPKKCDKSALQQPAEERPKKIIADSQKLGVPKIIMPLDISKGNEKLNTLFISQLFNCCPGLSATEEEYNSAKMMDDDAEGTREERSSHFLFRFQNVV